MFETNLFINGASVYAENGRTFERQDPLTNEVITRAAAGGPLEAKQACNAAAAAFASWSTTAPNIRADILREASVLMGKRQDEFIDIAAGEVGASANWTRFNVGLAQNILLQAASLTDKLEPEMVNSGVDGLRYSIRRQPAGVVVGIAPWNAPVTLATRALAAPLACGNTVVLKASELCPKVHSLIVEVMNSAGLPAGVLNYVSNAPEDAEQVVEALISHPAVRRINFTGSTRVGRKVAVTAAQHLKPCLLELSGKAALIVLEDADLDAAARAAAFGAFFNQGQICMSTERIIIVDSIADAFVEKLKILTEALRAGDPRAQDVPLGTMISADAALRVRGLVEDAVNRGATLVTGGEVDNMIMQPAVVDHVSSTMRIYIEESFGPVAAIMRAADQEEAVSIANDTEFGLSAAVFSGDIKNATDIALQLETGMCHINGATVFDDPAMPFGGTKSSGYGRFGGEAAIHEFTELRWVTIQEGTPEYPF